MFDTVAKMFKSLTLIKTQAKTIRQRKRQTTRLETELLEARLVPAFAKPVHAITIVNELTKGESSLAAKKYEDAFNSFQLVEAQAYKIHDSNTLLHLADDYRRLGGASNDLHGAFNLEKQAYNNAVGAAAFWAIYKGDTADTGDDRTYGLNMLMACDNAYSGLMMNTPSGYDLKVIQNGAHDLLFKGNNQKIEELIGGEWYMDNGEYVSFDHFHSGIIVTPDPKDFYVYFYEHHNPSLESDSTALTRIGNDNVFSTLVPHISPAGYSVGTWNEGPWQNSSATFSFNDCPSLFTHATNGVNFTFTYDPHNSGRMLVQDNEGHPPFEVYRKWDNVGSTTGNTGGTTGQSDIDKILAKVSNMTAADAAKVIWNIPDWPTTIAVLEKMDDNRVADILLNFNTVQNRADTLAHMTPEQAARVSWDIPTWKDTIDIFNKMDAKKVAQIVWNYSTKNLVNTLNHLTIQRTGDVLMNLNTWGDRKSTLHEMFLKDSNWPFQVLNQMPSFQVAQLITNAYRDTGAGVLNGMAPDRAAQALMSFGTWNERTDLLSKMSAQRIAVVIGTLPWNDMKNTLHELFVRDNQWPFKVLNQMPADRVAQLIANSYKDSVVGVLNGLAPKQAAEVMWAYYGTWTDFNNTINKMSVARAAQVIKQYDPSRLNMVLNNLTSSRKNAIIQAMNRM